MSGHASSSQMGLAAWAVLQKCVVEQGIGGVVAGIGK